MGDDVGCGRDDSVDADGVGHDVSGVAVTTEASLDADGVEHDVSGVWCGCDDRG